jgi:hypothetical protein
LLRRLKLERVAQGELNQPGRTHGGEDSAKRRTGNFGSGGVGKIRVIPDVEEIRGEAQFLALGYTEILD